MAVASDKSKAFAKAADGDGASPAKTRPARKKKSYTKVYVGVGVAVVSLIVWAANQQPQGTMRLGVCKVYLEQTVTYPREFKLSAVDDRPAEIRVDYSTINEYGEYIIRRAVCHYAHPYNPQDPSTLALKSVDINEVKQPQDKIDLFNLSIPAILANPPDLTLPTPPSDNLTDLQQ